IMDRCPLEIIELILSALVRIEDKEFDVWEPCSPGSDYVPQVWTQFMIYPFSTISRAFQYATERRIYKQIRIESSEIEQLDSIFAHGPHRADFIKSLKIKIDPKVEGNPTPQLKPTEQWHRNNQQ